MKLQRNGAELTLCNITKHFQERLPEKIPELWNIMIGTFERNLKDVLGERIVCFIKYPSWNATFKLHLSTDHYYKNALRGEQFGQKMNLLSIGKNSIIFNSSFFTIK